MFPLIGNRPIAAIKPRELIDVINRIEQRKAHHLAHRVLQVCAQVFRYGVRTERCESDPSRDLKGALTPHKGRHMPAVRSEELPELLAKIDAYESDFSGNPKTRLAMRLMALTFLRTGEMIGKHDKAVTPPRIIGAEWSEIDFERGQWIVPGSRMKMGIEHIVPLSRQALAILQDLRTINGDSRYIFAGRTDVTIMSENTIIKALDRMGYKGRMTGHGFRAVASTFLNEARGLDGKRFFDRDAIERQLAHSEKDDVRAAYNRAEYIEERRQMMQWWGDHLDRLRGGNVMPLRAV